MHVGKRILQNLGYLESNCATVPVTSSCNIPTVSLTVAQTMDPAPRPPSPCALTAALKSDEMAALEAVGMKDLNEVPHDAALNSMGLGPHTSPRSFEERDGMSANAGTMKDNDGESALSALSASTPKVTESPEAPTRPPRTGTLSPSVRTRS